MDHTVLLHVSTIGYQALLSLLACYGLYRYFLLALYHRVKDRRTISPPPPAEWPVVTIQLPVYNERYVVERVIRSACEVDYPAAKLDIQVLDDSTDDTSDIIRRTIEPYQRRGLRVRHLRRANRKDFKAGALAEALKQTTSELIAVFDADFIIPKDFLTRTVPHFTNPRIGMVQARWGHVNAPYSLLTRAQAMLLDGHFIIEQVARSGAGHFFNFNGTAGMWRVSAIHEAGGWQPDTLTEDLDLSYRAQLAGWRCVYLQDLVAPAELPVEMNAFKTQQYRWTKGSIQTAKKLLPGVLRNPLPWSIKLDILFYLTGFFSYPLGLLASLGLPLMIMGKFSVQNSWLLDVVWLLLLSVPGVCFYICAQREMYPKRRKRLLAVPWAMAVGMGMLMNNTKAVFDGMWGHGGTFVRTAKLRVTGNTKTPRRQYRAPGTGTEWLELALAAYFALGCAAAVRQGQWMSLPFALLFALGFGYVGGLSFWQQTPLGLRLRLAIWWNRAHEAWRSLVGAEPERLADEAT